MRRALGAMACIGLALLLSCDGGLPMGGRAIGDGIGGTGSPASATSVGKGAIEEFGSIFVNGVEWNTDDAQILLGNFEGSEADLQLGMIVTVYGERSPDGLTGTADLVVQDTELEGPVEAILPLGTFATLARVLDRNVVIFSNTHLGDDDPGFSLATLSVGDVVAVNGFLNFDHFIVASFVTRTGTIELGTTPVQLRGPSSDHDGSSSFMIGDVEILYDPQTFFEGITPAALDYDYDLEVQGTLVEDDVILADHIRLENNGLDDDYGDVVLEGLVTDFVDLDDFRIWGQRVNAGSAAIHGPGNLQNGEAIRIEGTILNGVLVASEIDFEGGE